MTGVVGAGVGRDTQNCDRMVMAVGWCRCRRRQKQGGSRGRAEVGAEGWAHLQLIRSCCRHQPVHMGLHIVMQGMC